MGHWRVEVWHYTGTEFVPVTKFIKYQEAKDASRGWSDALAVRLVNVSGSTEEIKALPPYMAR